MVDLPGELLSNQRSGKSSEVTLEGEGECCGSSAGGVAKCGEPPSDPEDDAGDKCDIGDAQFDNGDMHDSSPVLVGVDIVGLLIMADEIEVGVASNRFRFAG